MPNFKDAERVKWKIWITMFSDSIEHVTAVEIYSFQSMSVQQSKLNISWQDESL